MSTEKTIKIQKNKVLTYSINKSGFQTVTKSLTVTGDTTINENMVSQSGSPILQLGDRFLGISSFVTYFTPSGTYDVDSLKYLTISSSNSGLSNLQVNKELWIAQVEVALSVETAKGTSNTFTFTYNGSTWDLTGATTVSAISATDLADVYGISFTGTASNGDVITVVETQYNKFAVYVLDANYRVNNLKWANNTPVPSLFVKTTDSPESATYFNKYAFNNLNLSEYPTFNQAKNLGNFIMPNGIKINALIANPQELLTIWTNRVALDSFDPVIQGGSTTNNLTDWNFSGNNGAWCCSCYSTNSPWNLRNNGTFSSGSGASYSGISFVPIFEVPVM